MFDLEEVLKTKNIPILTLDEKWHQVFNDNVKTKEILQLEANLNELLKYQASVTEKLKDYKNLKSKLMEGVVANMDNEDDNPKKAKINAKNQKLILDAKEKIEELEDEMLDIPKRIRDANLELMIASVNLAFDKMRYNAEDIALLDKVIASMRIDLKKKLLIKQDKETFNTQTYAYLHDILGNDVMDAFDKREE